MTSITQGFDIEGEHIIWGLPFKDVAKTLNKFSQYPPYQGWSNLRCKCSEIYGLKTNEAEVRAPFEDRPIMQVIYQLASLGENSWGKLHTPYVRQLKEVFGSPTKTDSNYDQRHIKREYISGAVVYSAKWLIDDIRVSLSVYGGIRHEDSGDCAAGLFIDWINEKKAAEPFRIKNRLLEEQLLAYLTASSNIEKFTLDYPQRKFYVTHIDIGDPDVSGDRELRASQMALYQNELLQTPSVLQRKLKDNEIAIKFDEDSKRMIIANKCDATILNYDQEEKVSFINVLPARGPGKFVLQVKDLSINDSRKSDVLINLVLHIESKMGIKILRREGYDD